MKTATGAEWALYSIACISSPLGFAGTRDSIPLFIYNLGTVQVLKLYKSLRGFDNSACWERAAELLKNTIRGGLYLHHHVSLFLLISCRG